jgi:hypothetical protein
LAEVVATSSETNDAAGWIAADAGIGGNPLARA